MTDMFREEFAKEISEKVGHRFDFTEIGSDEHGKYFYFCEKSFQPNHPIIVAHYRGGFWCLLPYKEFHEIEAGKITPKAYIDQAFWSYGYYAGGGTLIGGSFWTPLEKTSGITDKALVSKFLSVMECIARGQYNKDCTQCEKCAFIGLEDKMHDYRVDLFKSLKDRAKVELDLELRGLMCYEGETAYLLPNQYRKDEASINLPISLLNDILYHPGDRDWGEIAKSFKWELGVIGEEDSIIIGDELTVPASEFCRNFWSAFGITDKWYGKKESVVQQPQQPKYDRFFTRIWKAICG